MMRYLSIMFITSNLTKQMVNAGKRKLMTWIFATFIIGFLLMLF